MNIPCQSLSEFLRERLKETSIQEGGDQLSEIKSDSSSEPFSCDLWLQVRHVVENLPRWAEAQRAYGTVAVEQQLRNESGDRVG